MSMNLSHGRLTRWGRSYGAWILVVLLAYFAWVKLRGPHYDIAEVFQPGVTLETHGSALNDRGEVVGQFKGKPAQDGKVYREGIFVFAQGSFKELPMPVHPDGVRYVHLTAINSHSKIVGHFQTTAAGEPIPGSFLIEDGQVRMDRPWSTGYFAIDINDAGDVVANGEIKVPCDVFDFTATTPPSMPPPTKTGQCRKPAVMVERNGKVEIVTENYARPTGIGPTGQVIHAISQGEEASGINGLGEVVGQRLSRGRFRAFIRDSSGVVRDLPVGNSESKAIDINDKGVVIGELYHSLPISPFPVAMGWRTPFVFRDGQVHSLARLAGFHWNWDVYIEPVKINNLGQILINVSQGGHVRKSLLLTPRT
jgi:hypothetical protein